MGACERVGVVGGGQLARMMIAPAQALGIEMRVFAENPASPAALAAGAFGTPQDIEALLEFARTVDVLTFEHEFIPRSTLAALQEAGVNLQPTPAALLYAQDKIALRRRLQELGLPQPAWAAVTCADELSEFLRACGSQAVVKVPGYDGRGVRVIDNAADAQDWLGGRELLAEEKIEFVSELSQLIARCPSGQIRTWDLTQTIQREGICTQTITPAADAAAAESARQLAVTLAEQLEVTGVMAVELFLTADGRLLVNELAMRPHNSGHWTIDAAVTSQFEQHLRAVLDLPLGDTRMRTRWAAMANLLGGYERASTEYAQAYAQIMRSQPAVKIHMYDKQSRPARKVGHLTAAGDSLPELVAAVTESAKAMKGENID